MTRIAKIIMSVVFGFTLLGFYSEKTHPTETLLSQPSNYFFFNQVENLETIQPQSVFDWDALNHQIIPNLKNKSHNHN